MVRSFGRPSITELISDAYARRDVRAQVQRALRRAFRVWWEGIACGFPPAAPILIAVAYESMAQNGETAWDFAEDCLVTHSPPGVLNTVTGVVGLAAMLWLYGVAWHEPMTNSIATARSALLSWVPARPSLLSYGFQGDVGKIGSIDGSLASIQPAPPRAARMCPSGSRRSRCGRSILSRRREKRARPRRPIQSQGSTTQPANWPRP